MNPILQSPSSTAQFLGVKIGGAKLQVVAVPVGALLLAMDASCNFTAKKSGP